MKAKAFTSEQVFTKSKYIKKGDLISTLTGENKTNIAKAVVYLGDEEITVGGDLAKNRKSQMLISVLSLLLKNK